MMLMLIVAEKLHDGSLKLTDNITTSRKAAEMGGSQVYLKEGETFSLDDMMKAVVVHSANDASVAVAEYIAGSTEAFVVMMNQQAAAIGMKDSHYYSVNGLPPSKGESADVASAYDQAILARELLKYPDVIRWASIDTAPFRARHVHSAQHQSHGADLSGMRRAQDRILRQGRVQRGRHCKTQ